MATEGAVHDIIRAPERAAPMGWRANCGWRSIVLSIGYLALYLALDRLSFIGALHGIGITPWDPSAGLAMALLIIKGLCCAPLVMAAELLSAPRFQSRLPQRCRYAPDRLGLRPAIREPPQYCGVRAFRPEFAGAWMSLRFSS